MQQITPFLWFNDKAEEAMDFYLSIFKDSKRISVMPGPGGKASGVSFELNGQRFIGLNGGPKFTFSEAVSFMVECDTQEEVDYLWDALSSGGGEQRNCGWLKDKFGLSWQVVPKLLGRLLSDSDPEKANRVMQAMLKMNKIELVDLQKAYDGK